MAYNEIEINNQKIQGHQFEGESRIDVQGTDATISAGAYGTYTMTADGTLQVLVRKLMDGNGAHLYVNDKSVRTIYFGSVSGHYFTASLEVCVKKGDVIKIQNNGGVSLWYRMYLFTYR